MQEWRELRSAPSQHAYQYQPVGRQATAPSTTPLTLAEFESHVEATERTEDGRVGGLDYALFKLCSESGEVAQLRAREILAGEPFPTHPPGPPDLARRARYALELSDVAWYLTEAARLLGLTIEEVLALNVMKLRRRRAPFLNTGRQHGKDPAGEQAMAEMWLADPSRVPVLVASLRGGATTSEIGALITAPETAPEPEEFQACAFCGDLTRHRLYTVKDEPGLRLFPVCKAPACREAAVVDSR